MSEYQYYEFQAIDRPLAAADREALRALSTRARITATSLTNHYEWGDFKGDPDELMERWFDLHLYLANWGTRRLMMRLPKRVVDRSWLDAFLLDVDWVAVREKGGNLIVDMYRDEVEAGYDDWDDGSGWLGALAPLRAEVLSGDLRLFYLLWLTALEDGLLEAGEAEPLAGIGPLTGALEAAAEFFGIDRDLVQAAAERSDSADGAVPDDLMRDALAKFPEPEKTDLLLRVIDGDPHVAAELKRRMRTLRPASGAEPRTVRGLKQRAAAIRRDRERAQAERRKAEHRRQAQAAERARRKRLDDLKRRGEAVWRDIEFEIERRNASAYDRATGLLFDLGTLAAEQGTGAEFARRLDAIRERHGRKGKFIERLKGLNVR